MLWHVRSATFFLLTGELVAALENSGNIPEDHNFLENLTAFDSFSLCFLRRSFQVNSLRSLIVIVIMHDNHHKQPLLFAMVFVH